MARCAYCNSTILGGGIKKEGLRFCNKDCLNSGYLKIQSAQIPDEDVRPLALEIFNGECPHCKKKDPPIEVHHTYKIWSALVMTRHSRESFISCNSCAKKAQMKASLFDVFLGWWGFPWGFIMTPIQIGLNLKAIASPKRNSSPSKDLIEHTKMLVYSHLESEESPS